MRTKAFATVTVVLAMLATPGAFGASQAVASRLPSAVPSQTLAATVGDQAARQTGRTIAVGSGPEAVAVDQATHTAYVGNGNDNTVSVINTATCDATVRSGCGQVPPTVKVGGPPPGPVDAAVDQATDTVYVVDAGGDTVSVIDGATCNATVTTGCGQTPQTITVGKGPDGLAIDQLTDTVYVANTFGSTVSVIDGATCNATVTTGCGQTPPSVVVGAGALVPAVNEATDTIYVPIAPPSGTGTLAVIDGATCNATVTTGCGQTPRKIPIGSIGDSSVAAVDQATDTVYVLSPGPSLGAVDVFNGATCNATVSSGCNQTPAVVTVGSGPIDVVVDPVTEDVFVVNEEDSTVSVIDGRICNALHTAGCGQHPPVMATGFSPEYLDVDLATDTLYVANYNENDVSVINAAACTLTHQSGCRRAAPTTTIGTAPAGIAVNQVTGTVYVSDRSDNDLSVINAATCNATHRSGCSTHWPTVATGVNAQAVAVDPRTDTIYTANIDYDNGGHGTTVSVINGATCNATRHSGCNQTPATVHVGDGPDALAVNDATDTIYVANGNTDTVSVINGATCNATIRTGCRRPPKLIKVGKNPQGVAIDQTTDTIYVTNGKDTVSVINGATCNATRHSGCHQTPPTIKIGNYPSGLAVDTATDTVYAENVGDNTVSVIDGATCNATRHSGCNQKPPTMPTGGAPFIGVAVDQATDTVFLGSVIDSDIDVYNGRTCNATVRSGCHQQPKTVNTGGWPNTVAVDPANGTVYAPDNVDGEVSFFAFVRPARPTHVTAVAHAGAVRVRWRAPAAGGLPVNYQVIPSPACPACRGLRPGGATSTAVTGLKSGRSYTFTVRASDAAGTGPRSRPSQHVTA
jgi:DNA-binding beta-propeller fold protein YncE